MSRTADRGWPIAAHIALLLAIALVAAYAVNVAVVAMLPPRPPDVVRADVVLDRFAAGYGEAVAGGRPRSGDGVRWSVQDERPRTERRGPGRLLSRELARRLDVSPRQVLVAFDPPPVDGIFIRVQRGSAHAAPHHDRLHREIVIERRSTIVQDIQGAPTPPAPPPPPVFAPPPSGVVLMSGFVVAAALPDGRWLAMRQRSNAETTEWIARAGAAIGGTLAVLLVLALLFANRLAAPIRRFAEAAQRVGVDPERAPVPEEGPRELRTAARAVNAMQGRLRALVAQRTEMLAAVAHDLRTPLMRMRLVAENADPAIRDKLTKEAAEIDALVTSFIAFARDDPAREARVRLDFAALVQSLIDDRSEAGQNVFYTGPDRLVLTGQPLGLKRLVDNLVGNALKYGSVARITLRDGEGGMVMEVADDGPGIRPEERENVFRPFVRGETAIGVGAGLGLAAAREIARAHGGDIEIDDGASAGAIVRVRLPH